MSSRQASLLAKERQRELNPCSKESELSMKCLDENKYATSECTAYFGNYKACRKFWSRVASDRESKGLYPLLPPLEEREAVKKQYKHLM